MRGTMDKKKTNRDKLKEVFDVQLNTDVDYYLDSYDISHYPRYDTTRAPLNDWLNAEYKDNGNERYISALKSKIKFLNLLVELINDLYEESLEDNKKLRKQIKQMKNGEKK